MNVCLSSSFISASILLLAGCMDSCRNEIIERLNSPGGKYEAVFFERNCGATTGYSKILYLSDSKKKINLDDHKNYVFSMVGETKVDVEWQNDDLLFVHNSASRDEVFIRSLKWGSVDILYRPTK